MHVRRSLAIVLGLGCVVLAACGDDDDAASSEPVVTLAPTTAAAVAPGNPPATPLPVTAETAGGYDPTASPSYPQDSTAVVSDPLADGVYWATVDSADQEGVMFTLVQAFFGQECIGHFGTEPESCLDDYGIDDSSTASVTMPLDVTDISVIDATDTTASYRITGAELARLVQGEAPSADAPAGFSYTFFPYLVTIAGGTVTAANQVYTP